MYMCIDSFGAHEIIVLSSSGIPKLFYLHPVLPLYIFLSMLGRPAKLLEKNREAASVGSAPRWWPARDSAGSMEHLNLGAGRKVLVPRERLSQEQQETTPVSSFRD